ncbi:MAG: OmpA family protein [Clostridia bacterium]|nr:OmpA family protein [Clostridia bacterium]
MLGIFVFLIVVFMIKGGIYISEHNKATEAIVPEEINPDVETAPVESPVTEMPDPVVTPEDLETEKIYSIEMLEDMKLMLFVFYFEKGQSDLNEDSLEQFDILMEVLSAYPEEPIVIEGHVNGYPNFAQTEENLVLSGKRSQAVAEYLIDRGIENSRITVYNFGSEVPYIRQSVLQHQNDRVTVYFKNHFTNGDLNK